MLCTKCRLCCTGAVFADVELSGRVEATAMECLGLEVEEEEGRFLLIQRCRAIGTKGCQVYDFRPVCCREFECKLLRDVESGAIELERALCIVHELRSEIRYGDRKSSREMINSHLLKS